MNKLKSISKKLLKNERGQGATEYILLLVVVVGLVVLFKDQIKETVDSKVGELRESISSVTQ